jgi:Fic family protein
MPYKKYRKHWNWQQSDWPKFSYDSTDVIGLEQDFLQNSGLSVGVSRHISADEQKDLTISLISNEAFNTSKIEGEILNRDSLQSSIKRHFGLKAPLTHNHPAENGIAEMMMDLYHHFELPLSDEILWSWHAMLMNGRRDLQDIGSYRTHSEPMQVVSGYAHKPTVHFEAPAYKTVPAEMTRFVGWFNATAPNGKTPLPALTRCAIAHLYFVTIHPFEDGNGRIGRALVEKILAQHLKQPTLIALSQEISDHKKDYYDALAVHNRENTITDWLVYFAKTVLQAQKFTIDQMTFLIEKTRFFDRHKDDLNPRQLKVVIRLMDKGLKGFEGGLSAKNYRAITKTSASTATRDLHDLIIKNILHQTGERKSRRYWLTIADIT